MKWRHKLALGIPVAGALAVCGAVIPVAVSAVGAQASVTTAARVEAAAGGTRTVPTPPRGKPVFGATFRGTHLNTKIWDTCYPFIPNYNGGCQNFGNHQEAEWYLPSQVKVSGGVVNLVAQRKRTVGATATGAPEVYGCRSGMITSYPGLKFEYGFVQVVASIPHANGLWPALWLGAANGQALPEIDMVESFGAHGRPGSFLHAVGGGGPYASYSPAITRGWQTYSLSWTRSALRFWVGSTLVLTVKKNVPHQKMYFLADLAENKPAKRGYCTGQLMIKSVKIWKS
jgi:beta-glucanase (GH16 family)